jgi:hypothetical protein
LSASPPSALVATVAWEAGGGMITSVNVWDNPSAVGDFFVERVQPVIEAEGPSDYEPVRHGNAVATYFRAQASSDGALPLKPATAPSLVQHNNHHPVTGYNQRRRSNTTYKVTDVIAVSSRAPR